MRADWLIVEGKILPLQGVPLCPFVLFMKEKSGSEAVVFFDRLPLQV